MSRAVHKQFMETMDLLDEAVNQLSGEGEKQTTLLIDMQELALALGNRVEKIKSDNSQTVPLLEKLCEDIYAFSSGEDIDLCETINAVRESLTQEFPDKVEMVFMPYKAAMWDSLESIWIAAEADAECEAHVVPMAYYDYDADGKYKEKHYEGDLFPKNVNVESYIDFDLEAHHPDVIFVHNPYDSYNRVTTVDPNFYSAELKKYAEKVVYVPYYATAGALAENWRYQPSYMNFDYIVLQAKEYVDYINPIVPKEKLLPMGSPKFDSAINKCRNSKGVYDKKTFFYNTSLGGMLNNTEMFLDKMEYVFDTFKRHPEVQILWRPHPLLESTFESMRPEYYDRFKKIKATFIAEKYGIYDDTPDMEETVAKCDAYIGDSSTSVISIFGVTGKPMFILNNAIHDLPTDEDVKWMAASYLPFKSADGHEYNKYRVTAGNQLFCRSEKNNRFEHVCELNSCTAQIYQSIALDWKDMIYIFPTACSHILKYDVKMQRMGKVPLKEDKENLFLFFDLKVYQNKVILLPKGYKKLVIFDMETENVEYVDGFREFNVISDPVLGKMPGATWIYGTHFYALEKQGKGMMDLDLNTMEIRMTPMQVNQSMVFGLMDPKTECLWLSPHQGTKVACIDLKTQELREYNLGVKGLYSVDRGNFQLTDRWYFWLPIFKGDKVVFSPFWANAYVELDLSTGKVSLWDCPLENYKPELRDLSSYRRGPQLNYVLPWNLENEEYLMYEGVSRKYYRYNPETDAIGELVFDNEYDVDEIRKLENGFHEYGVIIRYCAMENAVNTVEAFVSEQMKGNTFSEEKQLEAFDQVNASPNADCGKRVCKYIKEQIIN